MQVAQLFNLPLEASKSNGKLASMTTELLADTSFATIAPIFANHTHTAAILKTLNTISAEASRRVYGPNEREQIDSANTNTNTNTNANTSIEEPGQVAPYLAATLRNPQPLARIPTITRNTGNYPQLDERTRYTRGLTRSATRTARDLTGYEAHMLMRVTATSALAKPRAFRDALNIGGLQGPVVVIPTSDPRTLFVLGEPNTLKTANQAYSQFQRIPQSRGIHTPTATFSLIEEPDAFFTSASSVRLILQDTNQERIRLTSPNIQWRPKRFFLKSLDDLISYLRTKLAAVEPNASELRESTPADDEAVTSPRKRMCPPQTTEQEPQREQSSSAPPPLRANTTSDTVDMVDIAQTQHHPDNAAVTTSK